MQRCTRANSASPPQVRLRISSLLVIVFFLLVLVSPAVGADPVKQPPPSVAPVEPELFGADTALGRFSYHTGRGLRLGKTGLTVGGFTTVETELLEDGEQRGGIEELNFLISFDPVPFATPVYRTWGRVAGGSGGGSAGSAFKSLVTSRAAVSRPWIS